VTITTTPITASSRLALGVIGLGAMGREVLDVAAAHPDVSVAVCADLDAAAVARARQAHPSIECTTAVADVLDAAAVDAVYIATPPASHAGYALAAIDSGKAVLCEEPLAVALADGERMVAAALRAGIANAVNFALADRHAVLEVERALRAGEVGDVRGVEIRMTFPIWPREFQAGAQWLAEREQGGLVREVLSHFIYLTDRMLGPVTPVFTRLEGAPDRSEQAAFGLLQAGGNSVCVSGRVGAAMPESYEWLLHGTKRSYCLRDWGTLLSSDGGAWGELTLRGERGSEATRLSAFARAVRGRPEPHLPDFAAGLRVQRVIEAFHHGSRAA
jgi:1,5-anhydro-D-fructose reductase (1,5-anhydro-D-mannitol-forming)